MKTYSKLIWNKKRTQGHVDMHNSQTYACTPPPLLLLLLLQLQQQQRRLWLWMIKGIRWVSSKANPMLDSDSIWNFEYCLIVIIRSILAWLIKKIDKWIAYCREEVTQCSQDIFGGGVRVVYLTGNNYMEALVLRSFS